MKILCGTDIVEISRIERSIERLGDAFIDRCFGPDERAYYDSLNDRRKAESLSGGFAAKEAVSKALGTGIMSEGIILTDLEIVHNDKGAPELVLHGEALSTAERLGVTSTSISISHDGGYAVAYCTMLAED
ncbi:MAG: holo-ACP synthase [Clostridiales bacterium]|nr:holo-ACP synthase [Clostridiales bacterium]